MASFVEYEISHLSKIIEITRQQLVQLANKRESFTHPDVISLSQKLDRLLDEYQELYNNRKCASSWSERPEGGEMFSETRHCIKDDKEAPRCKLRKSWTYHYCTS